MEIADQRKLAVCESLASVLRSGREEFNRQFAEARRLRPDLDGAVFSEFLAQEVDPLVRAIEERHPERIADVVMAAYEVGLELAGQNLVGPAARDGFMQDGWRRVLIPVASLVARDPARLLSAVSNALLNLASNPGARISQWIEILERLGPGCQDTETLLRLGQVAAWKAGLAHYRTGAIAAADLLPPSLTLSALGTLESSDWPAIRQGLLASPWFDPARDGDRKATAVPFRVVAQAGAFRGFGGLFVEPPRVAAAGVDFLVRSGDETWLLTADLYGTSFHRGTAGEADSAFQRAALPSGLRFENTKIIWQNQRLEIPSLARFTSAAANETTLALTSELTHAVVLVALR